MTAVAAYAYAGGKRRREVSISRPDDMRVGEREIVWIGIVGADPRRRGLSLLALPQGRMAVILNRRLSIRRLS